MAKLKKIKVLSFGKFQAVLFTLLGLLMGIIYSIGGFIIDLFVSMGLIISATTPGLSFGTALAFLALLGMPIIFAIIGFILGIVEALLYNLYVRIVGELDIDFISK